MLTSGGRPSDICKSLATKKSLVDEIQAMLNDPEIEFSTTPKATMIYADFMAKIGAIKTKPSTWKDLCFDNVHSLNGS